jgi:hypothetical protein
MSHPFIPAPNTASVELIYQDTGEISENVFHVQKGSPFTLAQLQTLRGVVDTWDNTLAKGARYSGAVLLRIRTRALDTAASPTEDYYLPTPRPGTVAGAGCPLNVAFCMKLATGLAGRSYRGRWYWGHIALANLADVGHVSAGYQSGVVSGLNSLITSLATAGYTMVVTSYMTGGAWRTTAVNTAVTGAVSVDNVLDSQRRRLPGRGH